MRFTVALAVLLLLLFACHDPVPVSIDSPDMTQVPPEEPSPPPPPPDPSAATDPCLKSTPPGTYPDRPAECAEISGTTVLSAGTSASVTCAGWGRLNPTSGINDWYPVSGDRPRSWRSGNQSIVSVPSSSSPTVTISGVAPGTTSVTCTIDNAVASVSVTVNGTRTLQSMFILPNPVPAIQVGQGVDIAVHFVDNFNQVDKIHPAVDQWISDNTSIATVTPGQFGGQVARVTGVGSASPTQDGITSVKARVGGITSSPVTITVHPAPVVSSVSVSPTSATIAEFTYATLTATARDQFGNVMNGRSAIWSTNNQNVLSLSSAGPMSVYANGVHWGPANVFVQVDGVPGNTVPITVYTDGKISGYYVSSLSPWGDPFTSAGTYYLTPTTTTPPGPPQAPPLTYKWEITFSDNSRPPITTGYQSGSYPLSVHDGAYKIYVTVTPKSAYGAGYPTRWTYNVCTGGGGGGDPPNKPPVAVAPNSAEDYKGGVKPNSGGARPYRVVYGCSGPA